MRRRSAVGLVVLGLLALAVAAVVAIGWMLPVRHQVVREAVLPVPRDSLFGILTDIERFPEWRPGIERVERAGPAAGRTRYVEVGDDGEILFEIVESVPGRRLVTRIADPGLPFGGSWTWELEEVPGGTRLRITEDGEVYNPVFRFMSRFVFSHHRTIQRFLDDLQALFSGPTR